MKNVFYFNEKAIFIFSRSKVLFDLEKIATATFVVFFYNIDEM